MKPRTRASESVFTSDLISVLEFKNASNDDEYELIIMLQLEKLCYFHMILKYL